MEDLSLHILDIMENAVDAHASTIELRIEEDLKKNLLTLQINDDGRGMDAQTLNKAMDPFFTTRKTRRVGLGLSMLSESAKAAGGEIVVESSPGKGTRVKATFRLDHIDMKPLGDIPQTLLTLIVGKPEIDLRYVHTVDGEYFIFDTREARSEFGNLSISSPHVLRRIEKRIRESLDRVSRRGEYLNL